MAAYVFTFAKADSKHLPPVGAHTSSQELVSPGPKTHSAAAHASDATSTLRQRDARGIREGSGSAAAARAKPSLSLTSEGYVRHIRQAIYKQNTLYTHTYALLITFARTKPA